MLPSHLLDPTKKQNERLNRTRLGNAPPPPLPSLCLTGAMSQIGRYQVVIGDKGPTNEDNDNGNKDEHCDGGNVRVAKNTTIDANNGFPIILSYCIFRPRQLHDENKPPLLCLHGGPSIPSNYLLPIVNGVTDRAVIFYDQWGCGKSSRPPPQAKTNDENVNNKKTQYAPFSIPTMVEHLRQLIEEHWKLKRFHLLGHSFGGILAYEYLLTMKRQQEDFVWQHGACLCSLILSSTPTSAELIQSESERLFLNLTNGGNNDTNDIGNGDDDDDDDDDDGLAAGEKNACNPPNKRRKQQLHQSMKYSEEFRQTHECRLPNLPLSLMDALAQMGPIPWRGIQAIDGYEAGKEVDDSDKVPSLLMRGEYDFCTEHCMKGWKERLWSPSNGDAEPEEKVLSNCSHYAMLEDETLFGAEILRFVTSHDAHRRNDIF